jgi:hypothetical protein
MDCRLSTFQKQEEQNSIARKALKEHVLKELAQTKSDSSKVFQKVDLIERMLTSQLEAFKKSVGADIENRLQDGERMRDSILEEIDQIITQKVTQAVNHST